MPACLLGLGSNLGDRQHHLRQAVQLLKQIPQISTLRVSSWIETPPLGGPAKQGTFLNGATLFQTSLSPYQLFYHIRQIENRLGRRRDQWWGPRTIDLDILLYDRLILSELFLTIPHRWMAIRPFVLRPASLIAGRLTHPILQRSIGAIWDHHITTQPYIAIYNQSCQPIPKWLPELAVQMDAVLVSADSTVQHDPMEIDNPDVTQKSATTIKSLIETLAILRQEDPKRLCISDFWMGNYTPPSCLPAVVVILRRETPNSTGWATNFTFDDDPRRHRRLHIKDPLAPRLPHLIIDIGDLRRARQELSAVFESVTQFPSFRYP